ncbi:MAG: Mur ligase family protein, partial [Nitrospirales bacterium]
MTRTLPLSDLIAPLVSAETRGDLGVRITGLSDDSRRVERGHLFVAVKGEHVDGHDYVPKAIAAGAAGVVVQRSWAGGGTATGPGDVPLVRVADTRQALGLLASRFHGHPSARLRMVGVTGTNGKTTVTYLCRAVLEAGGRRVGVIGTIAYLLGAERLPAPHTTPGAIDLQRLLARMAEAGLDAVVMEVSSHALALDRVVGCEFDVAVFTNLTRDHMDF